MKKIFVGFIAVCMTFALLFANGGKEGGTKQKTVELSLIMSQGSWRRTHHHAEVCAYGGGIPRVQKRHARSRRAHRYDELLRSAPRNLDDAVDRKSVV